MKYEATTCNNIKDANHRNKVKAAVKKLNHELKACRMIPSTGLVFLASPDRVWSIIPNQKCTLSLYRCDRTFYLDPLRELLNTECMTTFGVCVVSGEETKFAHWKVNPTLLLEKGAKGILVKTHLDTLHSFVRNKHRRGGYSANRFHRLRENEVDHYVKEIVSLYKIHYSMCELTLIFGSQEKIECLKQKQRELASACPCILVSGNPFDGKSLEQNFLTQIVLFWKHKEQQQLIEFKEAMHKHQLVFGKECDQAIQRNMVKVLFIGFKDLLNEYSEVEKHIIYGFSNEGVNFIRDYHRACVLYPGVVFEHEDVE